MDDWLSFLIFAGLFYFMMRYGCGAHMIHGHKHGKNKDSTQKRIDPVCGMEVESSKGYGKMHKDTLYRFCSRSCLDKFEKEPDYYITQTNKKGINR